MNTSVEHGIAPQTVALFCRVIDNFGDIGVCWRLARQVVREHGVQVSLWVDDLERFQCICPAVQTTARLQQQEGVLIRHWQEQHAPTAPEEVADLVIEAFACELPASYVAAMAQHQPRPAWINLEYLSAEEWVEGCHGLPSPQPSGSLVKYFFFPGFSSRTGGLFRERELLEQRDTFLADPTAVPAFLGQLGVEKKADEALVSLFCYPDAPVTALLSALQQDARPVLCLVPEGVASDAVSHFLGAPAYAGQQGQRGPLRLQVIPFLSQQAYDRVLWACDMNFVRGEDSLLRAQWAGRPFVWQIYRQEEDAHLVKLAAFMERYLAGLAQPAAQALRDLNAAWNGAASSLSWSVVRHAWPEIERHHQGWVGQLCSHGDLASTLLRFAAKVRKDFG